MKGPDDGLIRAREGLARMGPELLELAAALDETFLRWAASRGAVHMAYPPLLRVTDLARVGYFANFPHLALVAAPISTAAAARYTLDPPAGPAVDAAALDDGLYVLPSAACYGVYADLAGSTLDATKVITTVATCFRRERHYDGLRRLLAFKMREIVCLGSESAVTEHLDAMRAVVGEYLSLLGVPITIQLATDPFYSQDSVEALMARHSPVKSEFVFGGDLAIGSMNRHRDFFGDRCDILTADGQPAFSGCVAFGIERWISALISHFGDDPTAVARRVREAE